MLPDFYKRKYHPILIIMYISGIMDQQQIKQLPKTTRWRWNKFNHKDYYGYEMAIPYIEQFDNIKDVFASSFLYKAMRFMVKSHRGYQNMLKELAYNKNLLKLHAKSIIESIEQMNSFAKVKVITACNYYGVSKDWYYAQKKRVYCELSPLRSCYRQYPNQLTQQEIATIEKIVIDPNNYGETKTNLYYTAMEIKEIICGKSTFNKYATAFGFKKLKPYKKSRKKGFRASRIFEWLHVDITFIHTQKDGKQKVAFIKDNYSKAILHYTSTSGKAGSEFIKNLFQETFEMYGLFDKKDPINILSDGGPENKGELISWVKKIKTPPVVSKITALSEEFPNSNSMSESVHSFYKSSFMRGEISIDKKAHLQSLKEFKNYVNQEHYFTEHFGIRPIDILNGEIPDKNLYKLQIEQARKERIETNRKFNACSSKIGKCGVF